MTIPVTGPGSDKDYKLSGSTGLFGESGTFPNGFPNGRMMYVKVKNAGDNIWFSFAKNGDAADIKSNPKLDKSKRIYQYRRGIPIYIDEDLEISGTLEVVGGSFIGGSNVTDYQGNLSKTKL